LADGGRPGRRFAMPALLEGPDTVGIVLGGVGRVGGFADGGRPGRRFSVAVVLNESAGLYSSYNQPRGKVDLN
jgi:hypothetical protein